MVYKKCFVPICENTSRNSDKIFVTVPQLPAERRKRWLDVVKHKFCSSSMHCCEDHFNLKEDALNFDTYRRYGLKLNMKPDVVPHLFLNTLPKIPRHQLTDAERRRKRLALKLPSPSERVKQKLSVDDSDSDEPLSSACSIKSESLDTILNAIISSQLASNLADTGNLFEDKIDVDSLPPEASITNPYLNQGFDQICRICLKLLDNETRCSVNKMISTDEPIETWEFLKLFSKLKPVEDLFGFICSTCFNDTVNAYKFQQRCNHAQMLLDDYTQHQQVLENIKTEIDIEETVVQVPPASVTNVEEVRIELKAQQTHRVEKKTKKEGGNQKRRKVHHIYYGIVQCRVCSFGAAKKLFQCKYCNKRFMRWRSWKCHLQVHNTGDGNTNGKTLIYPSECTICTHCEMCFAAKHALKDHILEVHTDRQTFTCEYCKKKFRRECALNGHLKLHADDRSRLCHVCGNLIWRSRLKRHLYIHLKHKYYLRPRLKKEVTQRKDDFNYHLQSSIKNKNVTKEYVVIQRGQDEVTPDSRAIYPYEIVLFTEDDF